MFRSLTPNLVCHTGWKQATGILCTNSQLKTYVLLLNLVCLVWQRESIAPLLQDLVKQLGGEEAARVKLTEMQSTGQDQCIIMWLYENYSNVKFQEVRPVNYFVYLFHNQWDSQWSDYLNLIILVIIKGLHVFPTNF